MQNCSSKIISDNEIEWQGGGLLSRENLTIAVGFPKGIVMPPPPPSFLENGSVCFCYWSLEACCSMDIILGRSME